MYEVFISFKNLGENGRQTKDSQLAEDLYLKLMEAGIETFFSNREIERMGDPRWGRLIDRALQESKVLVVVGTKLSHIQSQWVEYEWRYFSEQIRSGSDKQILTLLDGLHPSRLPPAFSGTQSYSPDSTDSLVNMIVRILKGTTQESYAAYSAPSGPAATHVSRSNPVYAARGGKTDGFFSAVNTKFFIFEALSLISALIACFNADVAHYFHLEKLELWLYWILNVISIGMFVAAILHLKGYIRSLPPVNQKTVSVASIASAALSLVCVMIYMFYYFDNIIDELYSQGCYCFVLALVFGVIGAVIAFRFPKNYATVASGVLCANTVLYSIMAAIIIGFEFRFDRSYYY